MLKSEQSTWIGSVVAVTDSNGALLEQQRYYPFGEVRTDVSAITQTDFGFTFQRDLDAQGNESTFGLMDYKARFYDPSLRKFIQPDTVTTGGPQALNRYSYVDNSPLNYVDPSGHKCTDPDPEDPKPGCGASPTPKPLPMPIDPQKWLSPDAIVYLLGAEKVFEMAGVEIYGAGWSSENAFDAASAIVTSGRALMKAGAGDSWNEAFKSIYGSMAFVWGLEYKGSPFSGDCANFGGGGCSPGKVNGKRVIAFNELHNYTGLQFSTLVTHELGHIFSYSFGWSYTPHPGGASDGTSILGSKWLAKVDQILFGDPAPSTYRHASSSTGNEVFADMFTAWAYGMWNSNPRFLGDVYSASAEMSADMSLWIP